MKPENIIVALEKFFFEIIGQLLPGFLLLVGFYFILPDSTTNTLIPTTELGSWTIVAISYAIGGALTTLGSYILIPFYLKIFKLKILSWIFTQEMKDTLKSNSEFDESLVDSAPYKRAHLDLDKKSKVSTIRNVAMSSIKQEDKVTTIRFMFLSLLSRGVSTCIFIVIIVYSSNTFLDKGISLETIIQFIATVISAFLIMLPFVLREREFYNRARRLPIESFFALSVSKEKEQYTPKSSKTVYLSGGHHSGWQDRVKNSVKQFKYLDPSKTNITDAKLYTQWDLEAVRNSDIVFAYLENSNPSGYGLSVEVGYAAALNKFIILIDEKSTATPEIASYLNIVRETANVVFDDFNKGITYLNSLAK